MNEIIKNINKDWFKILEEEFKKPYMINLLDFIKNNKKVIYPKKNDIFFCLNATPLNKIKVIIIGQDPYCFKNQANGLAFSVPENEQIPPSLKNIFKELYDDTGIKIIKNGYLLKWAEQGVLLLNNVLTVEEGKPGSHNNIGWEIFTDKIISFLSNLKKKYIFILLGKQAFEKNKIINQNKNIIIHASHPSEKSAKISFFGSRIFSKINFNLKIENEKIIDWKIE